MRTVAQSDAITSLPSLLDEVNEQPIVISRQGRDVAALVSIEDFNLVQRLNWKRMDNISKRAEGRVAEHAAELNITVDELIDRLLREDE